MDGFFIRNRRQGFSMVEVLVFVSILSMFFVIAVSISVSALRTMQVNTHKILASRYGEEALEWLRAQRDLDWTALVGRASTTGRTWCLNNAEIAWPGGSGNCTSFTGLTGRSPNIYRREVTLTHDGVTPVPLQITVLTNVSWSDYGITHNVRSESTFSIWEITSP